MQLGWWQKRELAVGSGNVAGAALGPFSVEGEGHTRAGTRGAGSKKFALVCLNRPSDYIYQRSRDYWGIGARAVGLIVGVEVELHPVELADALCGFFFLDFLRDDIGRTRPLRLKRAEIEAMEDLIGTLSPSELRARMRGRAIAPPVAKEAHEEEEPTEEAPEEAPARTPEEALEEKPEEAPQEAPEQEAEEAPEEGAEQEDLKETLEVEEPTEIAPEEVPEEPAEELPETPEESEEQEDLQVISL